MQFNLNSRVIRLVAILMMNACAIPAYAQDEQNADGSAQEAAKPTIKPSAAEIASKASTAQINDLATAGQSVVAVGERGIILTSVDGKDWKQSASPVDVLLNAVFFLDSQQGWAVGHDAAIIATADGGKTWKLQSFSPGLNKPLMDVVFIDAQRGFAVGAYGLFKATVDGGVTWTDFVDPVFEERQPHLNAITRLRDGALLLVGEAGLVAASEDGSSWRAVPLEYKGSLFGVAARGDHGAVVAGMRGNVYEAQDLNAGTWQQLNTGSTKSLFGLVTVGGDDLVAVGSAGTALVLRAGSPVKRLQLKSSGDNSESALFTNALYWRNNLLIATDHGFKTVGIAKPKT